MLETGDRARGRRPALPIGIALLANLGLMTAQVPYDLRRMPVPHLRYSYAFAVDPGSGAALLQGGPRSNVEHGFPDETWLWANGSWQPLMRPRLFEPTPPAADLQRLLVDRQRRRLLLVGGQRLGNSTNAEERSIWQFQGGQWTQLYAGSSAVPEPSPGWSHYAYDELRDRIVACEFDANGVSRTWEWGNGVWAQLAPTNAPPSRLDGSFAYLAARQRCMLFGGEAAGYTLLNDTWEWDGINWQQVPGAAPSPRRNAACAEDPVAGRMLLVGGSMGAPPYLADVWSYGTGGWTQLAATGAPPRTGATCAFDPASQRLLLVGGFEHQADFRSDLWDWNGGQWQLLAPTAAFWMQAYVSDLARNRVLAIDSNCQVWQRSGPGWVPVPTGTAPPPRYAATIGYDIARGRTVLFGGNNATPPYQPQSFADTWEWTGNAWVQLQPPTYPGVGNGRMASDPAGGVLMFGIFAASGPAGATWNWNGTNWTLRNPAVSPPSASFGFDMATDLARGVVVWCDGVHTWEWDGSQWSLRSSSPLPNAGVLAYDPVRQVVSLITSYRPAGYPNGYMQTEIWEWDGATWRLAWGTRVDWIDAAGYVFDPAARRLVIADDYQTGSTYEFGAFRQVAKGNDLSWQLPFGCAVPSWMILGSGVYLGESTSLAYGLLPTTPMPCFLLVGMSSSSWNGVPLPLDLTSLGAPCCSLVVSPDQIRYLGLSDSGWSPVAWLRPPMDPRLAGRIVNFQGVYLAPGANAAGLQVTRGLAIGLGMR